MNQMLNFSAFSLKKRESDLYELGFLMMFMVFIGLILSFYLVIMVVIPRTHPTTDQSIPETREDLYA